ncbi:amino acid ABC transporter permease [Acuticoccus sp. M5D2P5]|uniref:amino acid ABC transporter permease n=1 Tax=Acuticoccus kalidii TaxID=2910977 RepID=UPI001F185615|nr:amino acid ABC transporter permease [Acuticoccus kalidii]MCF3934796.1 amino acid ABC transporter permease [Acuticoccus kalidii]
MFGSYTFDWTPVWNAAPELLYGAYVSLQIAVLTFLLGSAIAFFLALAKNSGRAILSVPANAWIEVSRNTPCLFQIYMLYFGLGAIAPSLDSYSSVFLAITFNNAGYMAEIIRGGLKAIPPTQTRAARGLGLTAPRAYLFVIVPQLIPVIYFPSVNQFIWSLLNTSLGMIVGLNELTGVTYSLQSITFRTFEFFIVTAALYYVMVKIVTALGAWGSRVLLPNATKGERR